MTALNGHPVRDPGGDTVSGVLTVVTGTLVLCTLPVAVAAALLGVAVTVGVGAGVAAPLVEAGIGPDSAALRGAAAALVVPGVPAVAAATLGAGSVPLLAVLVLVVLPAGVAVRLVRRRRCSQGPRNVDR